MYLITDEEAAAVKAMRQAYDRLKELGWERHFALQTRNDTLRLCTIPRDRGWELPTYRMRIQGQERRGHEHLHQSGQ